jgi:hypothetical protein
MWKEIHTAAIICEPRDFPGYLRTRLLFLGDKCQDVWDWINNNPMPNVNVPDIHISEKLFRWTFDMHNWVNIKLGKSCPDYNKIKCEYLQSISNLTGCPH